MPTSRVLIVDDEEGMLEVFADTLGALDDVSLSLVQDSRNAAARLAVEPFDLLITDLKMPHLDGMELLKLAQRHDPEMPALVLTAFPSVDTAVGSMKLGAVDYLQKPFKPEEMLGIVRHILQGKQLRDENRLLLRQVERPYRFDDLVGKSAAMQRVYELIVRIAESDADVLILGETGTGKELVARSVHKRSGRAAARFVPVDCGAIPDSLMESELFGHERGAFTGAVTRSLGLLEFAHRGTLFLDEVGELPPVLQSKLLRVLQDRMVRRVGGNEQIQVDVRILSATSRDLEQEIAEQRFREDLFYRINVARIVLPPLRERSEDIPLLVRHFVERLGSRAEGEPVEVDPDVLEILCRHPWPGNVRQLQNVIRRMLATSSGHRLAVDDVPEDVAMRAGGGGGGTGGGTGFFEQRDRHLAAFEVETLTRLLREHSGDVSRVARAADLPRGTVYRLFKKYGIVPSDYRD